MVPQNPYNGMEQLYYNIPPPTMPFYMNQMNANISSVDQLRGYHSAPVQPNMYPQGG